MTEAGGLNGAEAQIFLDYIPFLESVGDSLELDGDHLSALAGVDPRVWCPWMLSVLSGGEASYKILATHAEAFMSPEACELMGGKVDTPDGPALDYRLGGLAQRVRELYVQPEPASQYRFAQFSEACAGFLSVIGQAHRFSSPLWKRLIPQYPQTYVDTSATKNSYIGFGASDYQHPIDGQVQSIVTLGPGMSGSIFALFASQQTEAVHFVSGGVGAEFINIWVGMQLGRLRRDIAANNSAGHSGSADGPDRAKSLPEAHFYRDGIAASMGGLAVTQQEYGPLDVAVMSAVHSAGPAECLAGIDGLHPMLREGGVLAVKAPHVSLGKEAGLDVVVPHAVRLFGSPVAAGECGTNTQFVRPDLPRARAAGFAIFQKQ